MTAMDPAMYDFDNPTDDGENTGVTWKEASQAYQEVDDREELVYRGPDVFAWYEEDEDMFAEADTIVKNDLYAMVEDWFPRVQQLVEQYRDDALEEEAYEEAIRDAVTEVYPITVADDVPMFDYDSEADGAINRIHYWLEETRQRFDLSYPEALGGE